MPRPSPRPATLDYLWVHVASVRRYQRRDAMGAETFADPVDVPGLYIDKEQIVVGAGGEQILATGTFAFARDIDPVPLQSRLTLPAVFGGRELTVTSESIRDTGALPLPNYQQIGLI